MIVLTKEMDIFEQEVDHAIAVEMAEVLDHGILVSKIALLLSKELGMDEEFYYYMAEAGVVHDIGKLRMSHYLYSRRKDAFMIEEMKYVRMHATFSYEILKSYDYPEFILKAIYSHHENFDGSGYPNNLKGEDIPWGARILRICDVFTALISERYYRSAFDIETAIQLMIEEVKNFDMEVFLIFLELVNSEQFKDIKDLINKNKIKLT